MKLYEEKLKREIKYEGQLVDVYLDDVLIHETQTQSKREVVNHIGGVCVAAMTHENKFLMVRQYRYAQQEVGLEFIAGKKEPQEDPDISIKRELLEEGGAIAKTWMNLGTSFPSPAYLNEEIQLYFAQDLEFVGQNLDDDEVIILEQLTLDEIIHQIETHQIKDLKTIALAYRLQHELNKVSNRELETSRLILKPIKLSDANEVYDNFNEDIIEFLYPNVHESLDETIDVLENMIDKRREDVDYVYTIRNKQTNEFLGLIGLHQLNTEAPELGIWLKQSAHNQKYGTESVRALLNLTKALGYHSVTYPVDHRNKASVKIPLHFNGKLIKSMQQVTTLDKRQLEIVTYEIKLNKD